MDALFAVVIRPKTSLFTRARKLLASPQFISSRLLAAFRLQRQTTFGEEDEFPSARACHRSERERLSMQLFAELDRLNSKQLDR